MRDRRAGAQTFGRGLVASLFGAIMCLAAGGAAAEGPLKLAGSQLEPVKWSELAGWTADDHLAAFAAYQASCQALRKFKSPRGDDRGQISAALSNVCRNAMELRPKDADTARVFFERNFQPVRISRLGEAEGLLTGYSSRLSRGRGFRVPNSQSRSIAGRRISSLPGTSPLPLHSRTKGGGSVAATRTTSSCPTTTARP
jgi:hypothetical protein